MYLHQQKKKGTNSAHGYTSGTIHKLESEEFPKIEPITIVIIELKNSRVKNYSINVYKEYNLEKLDQCCNI